ncbi:MAG: hypothetical protein ABMA14_27225, partial [Hyphomonadaceae bacterium]
MNLTEAFLAQVEARPEAAAIIMPDGHVVSYADLSRASAARAAAYAMQGIGAGDVVLIPGMSAEVVFVAEKRTALEYLLKPLN